jgi:hypothetical protein
VLKKIKDKVTRNKDGGDTDGGDEAEKVQVRLAVKWDDWNKALAPNFEGNKSDVSEVFPVERTDRGEVILGNGFEKMKSKWKTEKVTTGEDGREKTVKSQAKVLDIDCIMVGSQEDCEGYLDAGDCDNHDNCVWSAQKQNDGGDGLVADPEGNPPGSCNEKGGFEACHAMHIDGKDNAQAICEKAGCDFMDGKCVVGPKPTIEQEVGVAGDTEEILATAGHEDEAGDTTVATEEHHSEANGEPDQLDNPGEDLKAANPSSRDYEAGYSAGLKEREQNTIEVITPPGARPIAVDATETRSASLDAAKAATSKIGAITDMLESETPTVPSQVVDEENMKEMETDAANEETEKAQIEAAQQQPGHVASAQQQPGQVASAQQQPGHVASAQQQRGHVASSVYSADRWMEAELQMPLQSSAARRAPSAGPTKTAAALQDAAALSSRARAEMFTSFFPTANVKARNPRAAASFEDIENEKRTVVELQKQAAQLRRLEALNNVAKKL